MANTDKLSDFSKVFPLFDSSSSCVLNRAKLLEGQKGSETSEQTNKQKQLLRFSCVCSFLPRFLRAQNNSLSVKRAFTVRDWTLLVYNERLSLNIFTRV